MICLLGFQRTLCGQGLAFCNVVLSSALLRQLGSLGKCITSSCLNKGLLTDYLAVLMQLPCAARVAVTVLKDPGFFLEGKNPLPFHPACQGLQRLERTC